jgi:DNA-binding transcriptional ArsR family regulator
MQGGINMFELSSDPNSKLPFLLRMSKLFADPIRVRILSELTMRPMSPKQFFAEFGGGSLSRVARHFKVLFDYDWVVLVEEKSGGQRRGGVEHFYRAVEPAVFEEDNWADLPEALQEMVTWQLFATYAEQFKEAMVARTIDARPERHITWSPALLDSVGWKRVLGKAMEFYNFISEEQEASNERTAETGEKPIPVLIAISVFETPPKPKSP